MIDLHCHILPGVDDGPSGWDESLEMARIASSEGIRMIVATPHIKDNTPSPDTIDALTARLNALSAEHGINIRIISGAEVPVHAGVQCASSYRINGSQYVLMEFHQNFISSSSANILFSYVTSGLLPIIGHAERLPAVMENPAMLASLIEMGCLIQVTGSSITGEMGPEAMSCAHYLLRNRMAHVIATDAHSSSWRPPAISKAAAQCRKLIGEHATNLLTYINPDKIINGQPLDKQ